MRCPACETVYEQPTGGFPTNIDIVRLMDCTNQNNLPVSLPNVPALVQAPPLPLHPSSREHDSVPPWHPSSREHDSVPPWHPSSREHDLVPPWYTSSIEDVTASPLHPSSRIQALGPPLQPYSRVHGLAPPLQRPTRVQVSWNPLPLYPDKQVSILSLNTLYTRVLLFIFKSNNNTFFWFIVKYLVQRIKDQYIYVYK